MARNDRLKEVYEYVRQHFPIHTQDDFAKALGYNRSYISSAMNGNKKYLTDKLFKNIIDAFPDVFNLDYLLTGEGDLLTVEEDASNEYWKNLVNPKSQIDQSSIINAALAAKDETIKAKNETIESLRDTIESLRRENALLRQQLSKYQAEEMYEHHPFPGGVAEKDDYQPVRV